MATKKYKSGSKVKVYLKKSDFTKVDDNIMGNYVDPDDCPLARAIKRTFKTTNVVVGACDWGTDIDDEHWANTNEWDCIIARNVAECLLQGDKTEYYVTLTKE